MRLGRSEREKGLHIRSHCAEQLQAMARTATTSKSKKPATAVSIGKQPRSLPPVSSESNGTSRSATNTGKQPRKPIRPVHLRKQRRWRPGTKALREIRRYQKEFDLLIRKLPFQRLVKEILHRERNDFRMTADSVLALQVVFLYVFFLDFHRRTNSL